MTRQLGSHWAVEAVHPPANGDWRVEVREQRWAGAAGQTAGIAWAGGYR